MDQSKDGGAAFPTGIAETGQEKINGKMYWKQGPFDGGRGMSLRDYFAIRIFAALVCSELHTAGALKNCTPEKYPEHMAGIAYRFADAMLAERVK